jgi:hypothetical protein
MLAKCPLGGRFLCRFLHARPMHGRRTILAAAFFPSTHQFKQAIETLSSDSKIRRYLFRGRDRSLDLYGVAHLHSILERGIR